MSEELGTCEAQRQTQTPPFGKVPTQIVFDKRVTPAMLRVYCALAIHADADTRLCWPKQETLAKELSTARPNINRAIKQLVEFGYVLKLRRKDEKGGDLNCTYRLTLPAMYRHDTPPVYQGDTPPVSSRHTPPYQGDTPITDQYRTDQLEHPESANALRASADADDAPAPLDSSATSSYSPEAAPAADPTAVRQHKAKASRPRKLTDEQLAAHREEAVYVNQLLSGICECIKTNKLPLPGRERDAAHWFYRAGENGAPAPLEDVLACYRATKCSPFWAGKYLSLQQLEGCWVTYRLDHDAYIREQQKGQRDNGTTARTRGSHAAVAAASRAVGTAEEWAEQAERQRRQRERVERKLARGLDPDSPEWYEDEDDGD